MNRFKGIIVLTVFTLSLIGLHVFASEDAQYKEPFKESISAWEAGELSFTRATTAESIFTVATVSDTYTTGHGEVQFKVFWNGATDRFQLCIWSHYCSVPWYTGYRQWFQAPSGGPFAAWPRSGSARNVGWPPAPTIIGMKSSIQLLDVDEDGDLDVFQLVETSSAVWTVYLYKNHN
jgi:hypothetical protein